MDSNSYKKTVIYGAWLVLFLYLLYMFSRIAWFDSLSSIANDSVNYLIMARYYSPWVEASSAITQLWPEQDFPPLFPLLLAISGAAHSLLYAHVLVAVLGMLALFPLYKISRDWLQDQDSGWSVFAVILFALSPGYLLGMQGILSESLYLLISLIFIWLYQIDGDHSNKRIIFLSLLLAGLMLTRTIGVALFLALLAQACIRILKHSHVDRRVFKLPVLSGFIFLLAQLLVGTERDSHYPAVVAEFIKAEGFTSLFGFVQILNSQLNILLEAWHTFWVIYWLDGYGLSYLVILVFLFLSITGLLLRLRRNCLDAWYVLLFCMVLLVWPHPGQMVRLMFPVMPLMLLYAAYGTAGLFGYFGRQSRYPLVVFFLCLAAAVIPAQFYMHGRINIASKMGMIPVYEYFRKVAYKEAEKELLVQNRMMKDFEYLGGMMAGDELVMYVMPEYPAVLADVRSSRIIWGLDRNNLHASALASGADYVLMTHIHPRKTRIKYEGINSASLHGWGRNVWCSRDKSNITVVSCLYRVAL